MRPTSPLLITAGVLLFAAVHLAASDVKIIANPSVKAESISGSELKSVFLLQRKTLKDGSRVVPVLERSGAAHQDFLREYLSRNEQDIQSYYQGLVFTGQATMPKELDSDEEMVAYVARTKGAIGYVSAASGIEGVKVLVVVPEGRGAERVLLTRVEPEYPEALRWNGIAGIVRLELTISPKGEVDKVTLLGGNPILAESAMKAVKRWVYSPAPSSTTVVVGIPFGPHP